eukprot:1879017-Pleurochrysis_carterae.AAC.1
MRVGKSNRRIAPAMLIRSKGKSDEHSALGQREHATLPAAPRVFVTGVCSEAPCGRAVKARRQREGVLGTGTSTIDGRSVHHCRV